MFDIDKSHCVTTEQKLLWNIMESLKKETPLVLPEKKPCKHCGEAHDNKGQELACAKKHSKLKKESE
jgi:hypothetical protein